MRLFCILECSIAPSLNACAEHHQCQSSVDFRTKTPLRPPYVVPLASVDRLCMDVLELQRQSHFLHELAC